MSAEPLRVIGRPLLEAGASVRRYVLAHWRGEQSLARSFWLNLVLLRALVFALQQGYESMLEVRSGAPGWLVLASVGLAHGVLFAWQVVGALRAAERDLMATGVQATSWGVQLVGVVLCFLTFAHVNEGWQMSRPVADERRLDLLREAERRASYTLRVDRTTHRLHLDGEITLGITRRVASLLAQTPAIESLWLDSAGGNVFAARGLARVVREHGLATHADRLCASACTIAFMAGDPRSIGATGRLGFHRYRLDGQRGPLASDPAIAQGRDRAAFVRAGVTVAFAARLFDRPPDQMWWPTHAELTGNGVVDRIAPDATTTD